MKTIYLIRHAKSSWNDIGSKDFDRILNKRGEHDAPLIGRKLNNLLFKPDLIVCSPAKRTTITANLICQQIDYSFQSVQFEPSIYEASLTDLKNLINSFSNNFSAIALIGHNPSITLLSNYLTDQFLSNMPTCGVVKIELEIDSWNEIIQGIGRQKYFIYPKMYYQ